MKTLLSKPKKKIVNLPPVKFRPVVTSWRCVLYEAYVSPVMRASLSTWVLTMDWQVCGLGLSCLCLWNARRGLCLCPCVTTPRGLTSLPTGGEVYYSGFYSNKQANKQTNKAGSLIQSGASGLPNYCEPLVCVPDVNGLLAVWRHNKQKTKNQARYPPWQKRVQRIFGDTSVTSAQQIRAWHPTEIWVILRSPVQFLPKPRELKFVWIWADKPSSKGSELPFPVIKANRIKSQHAVGCDLKSQQ